MCTLTDLNQEMFRFVRSKPGYFIKYSREEIQGLDLRFGVWHHKTNHIIELVLTILTYGAKLEKIKKCYIFCPKNKRKKYPLPLFFFAENMTFSNLHEIHIVH